MCVYKCSLFFFFFFFQAEDGIRDGRVTGVQRVLFRSPLGRVQLGDPVDLDPLRVGGVAARHEARGLRKREVVHERSEERRVGKSVDLGGRRSRKKKKKKKRQ